MNEWKVFEGELHGQLWEARLRKPQYVETGGRVVHGATIGREPRILEYYECARYAIEARKLLTQAGYYPVPRWVWQSPDPYAARVAAYAMEYWYGGISADRIDFAMAEEFAFRVDDPRFLIVARRTLLAMRIKYLWHGQGIQLVRGQQEAASVSVHGGGAATAA